MTISELAAYAVCAVLSLLVLFQLVLIFGAPFGDYAWGGAHKVLPRKLRVGSFVSIILYGIFAVVVLDKAKVTGIIGSENAVGIGIWVLTAYFFIGVIMNGISRSKSERAVMTPVALTLAILCLAVATS